MGAEVEELDGDTIRVVMNKKPISTTHVLPNNEHLDIKDIHELLDGINTYYSTDELKFISTDDLKFTVVNKVKDYVIRQH